METAGKAVFTSGLAVFAALMAVALVPSPTFRTVPLGIALSVCFVLAASLTLARLREGRDEHRRNAV